ncbi:hypothetical protein EVAR_44282_1 [Eumeta japonica]|uniref:Uncharacterized protein n=1 Tax=Eumeta variegata TaxID=151549 RepID=A0A4C1WPR9_EUMVA|nr:hypothetical protein EVAR_44282_1 [Eumeta japonica]
MEYLRTNFAPYTDDLEYESAGQERLCSESSDYFPIQLVYDYTRNLTAEDQIFHDPNWIHGDWIDQSENWQPSAENVFLVKEEPDSTENGCSVSTNDEGTHVRPVEFNK